MKTTMNRILTIVLTLSLLSAPLAAMDPVRSSNDAEASSSRDATSDSAAASMSTLFALLGDADSSNSHSSFSVLVGTIAGKLSAQSSGRFYEFANFVGSILETWRGVCKRVVVEKGKDTFTLKYELSSDKSVDGRGRVWYWQLTDKGAKLVVWYPDNSIKVTSIVSGAVEGTVDVDVHGKVSHPELTNDGSRLIVLLPEADSIKFIDTASGVVVGTAKLAGADGRVSHFELTSDGSKLVVKYGSNHSIVLINTANGAVIGTVSAVAHGGTRSLRFTNDGSKLIVLYNDNSIEVMEIARDSIACTKKFAIPGYVRDFQLTSDGSKMTVLYAEKTSWGLMVGTVDLASGDTVSTANAVKHGGVRQWNLDGSFTSRLMVWYRDHSLRMIDMPSGAWDTGTKDVPINERERHWELANDGSKLTAIYRDDSIRVSCAMPATETESLEAASFILLLNQLNKMGGRLVVDAKTEVLSSSTEEPVEIMRNNCAIL